MLTLTKDFLITRVSNAVAAGQSEIDSTALDMQGFEHVAFIIGLNAVTDNSVMQAVIKSNPTNSNTGGTTEVSGTSITALTSSNKTIMTEKLRPSQRYVYLAFTRTTQNAAIDGIWAVQYGTRNPPVAQTILDAILGGP